MKIRSGHIPTDITYLFGPTIEVANRWDDAEQEDGELVKISVIPTFVADADNKKTLETGRLWSERMCKGYDHKTQKQITLGIPQKSQRENLPMDGIRIVSLEHRGEGGRAYKVITKDNHYFDLREDVLLDAMLTEGISPGGILNGKFMFARVASEMKLVRYESELFRALLEAGERSILSSVSKADLKVGGLYEGKQGAKGLFLGFVSTEELCLKWPNGQTTSQNNNINRNAASQHPPVPKSVPTLTEKKFKKHMLWLDISSYHYPSKTNTQAITTKLLMDALGKPNLDYSFSLRASHSMVKLVMDIPIPGDVIEQVQTIAVNTFEKRLNDIEQNIAGRNARNSNSYGYGYNYGSSDPDPYWRTEHVCSASGACLMRQVGAPQPSIANPTFQVALSMVGKAPAP